MHATAAAVMAAAVLVLVSACISATPRTPSRGVLDDPSLTHELGHAVDASFLAVVLDPSTSVRYAVSFDSDARYEAARATHAETLTFGTALEIRGIVFGHKESCKAKVTIFECENATLQSMSGGGFGGSLTDHAPIILHAHYGANQGTIRVTLRTQEPIPEPRWIYGPSRNLIIPLHTEEAVLRWTQTGPGFASLSLVGAELESLHVARDGIHVPRNISPAGVAAWTGEAGNWTAVISARHQQAGAYARLGLIEDTDLVAVLGVARDSPVRPAAAATTSVPA